MALATRAAGSPGMRPDAGGSEAGLRDYLRDLWRRRWIVALVTALVVGGALAFSFLQKPQYTAKADLLLQSPTSAVLGGQSTSVDPTDVATQIQIITSAPVQAAVTKQLHAPAPSVNVSEVGQTDVVAISATAPNARQAAAVANAYANSYVSFRLHQGVNSLLSAATVIQNKIDSLDKQLAALTTTTTTLTTATTATPVAPDATQIAALTNQVATYETQLDQIQVNAQLAAGSAQVVTPAAAPSSPSSPRPARTGALAAGVGLLLGGGVALLIEAADDSIETNAELEAVGAGVPVLGVIPRAGSRKERNHAVATTLAHPRSQAAEAYRQMRTSLQFIHLTQHHQVIQVTSPASAEGKTTTAVNLALTLAQSGQRVVLVDADLRRPRVHEYFGLDRSVGLTTVLLGDAQLKEALINPDDVPGLSVLVSGAVPPNPAEILGSAQITGLLSELRKQADVVVIDSPPVLPVADATALATNVDSTLVVVMAGVSRGRALGRALELLGQVEARISGLVLNGVPAGRRGRYHYGYAGYYGYASRHDRDPGPEAEGNHAGNGNGNGNGSAVPKAQKRQ